MKGLVLAFAIIAAACATARPVPRTDVLSQLIQFHGAVAAQYDAGGMELEHYNLINKWIGDEIRILTTNSKQFEGQARLKWPVVRSICAAFDSLAPWTHKIDEMLQ